MLINWEQAQDRGKIGGEFFFQLLELGYEKFPHNTTALKMRKRELKTTEIYYCEKFAYK